MKTAKLMSLMLMAVIFAFASCSKGPEKLIVKTWKVTNVAAKGAISDTDFQQLKAELMNVEMAFKNGVYTMTSNGNTIEKGSYSVQNGKLVVKTQEGLNMDATVTKDRLILETPDFTTSLQPK